MAYTISSVTQDCKRGANPAHFSLAALFSTPKNRTSTKYVTAIAALAAPMLLPDGIQTAQATPLADEIAQFEVGAGRPPSPTAKDASGYNNTDSKMFWHKNVKSNFIRRSTTGCTSGLNPHYQIRAEGQQDILACIVMFYNSRQLHSYLGYISPNECESTMVKLKKLLNWVVTK